MNLYGNMTWMDDDLLIFVGYKKTDLPAGAKSNEGSIRALALPSVFILDVKTGHIKEYVKRAHTSLCYDRGYIIYGRKKEDSEEFIFLAGEFGEEKENLKTTEQMLSKRGLWQYRCQYRENRLRTNHTLHLYEEDGFLEIQVPSGGNRGSVMFYRPGVAVPVSILDDMVQNTGIGQGFVHYYAFKRAYFSWASQAWWLFPDGRTAREPLLQGPWNKCYRFCASFTPSAKGILVNYHPRGEARGSELFIMQNDDLKTIVKGLTFGLSSVSPNGCLVAIQHMSPESRSEPPIVSLSVLNVCAHEK